MLALIALLNFMVSGLSWSLRAFATGTALHHVIGVAQCRQSHSSPATQALNVTQGRTRATAWMSPASSWASITGPIGL